LRDLLDKGFSGREVRYLLLTAHYRETFNFTLDGLQSARTSLSRIDECLGKLRELAGSSSAATDEKLVQHFTDALDEDLNISGAWGVVFEWVRETNRRIAENSLKSAEAASALAAWGKIDTVLGVGAKTEAEIPAEILALAEARTAAKKGKDFKRADAIREELKAKGWAIEDTAKGPKLKKI
jgi:cysteinyl-tRNA synthetase